MKRKKEMERYLVLAKELVEQRKPLPAHQFKQIVFERQIQLTDIPPNIIQLEVKRLSWKPKDSGWCPYIIMKYVPGIRRSISALWAWSGRQHFVSPTSDKCTWFMRLWPSTLALCLV
jgi:hypothetical protein